MIRLMEELIKLFGAVIAALGVTGVVAVTLWMVGIEAVEMVRDLRQRMADNKMFEKIEEYRNEFASPRQEH